MSTLDTKDSGVIRTFATGATRDSLDGKLSYEGFLCPFVLERFAQYMHVHRKQPDGSLRAADNWQKGISKATYMDSLWRHFHAAWKIWRGGQVFDERDGHPVDIQEALCGVLFNSQGFIHEDLKEQREEGGNDATTGVGA